MKTQNQFQNDMNIVGFIFNSNLKFGTTKPTNRWHPNENFISGTVNVATDENAMTVVPVNFFAYETRKDRDGKIVSNDTYEILRQISSSGACYEKMGPSAMRVRISASVDTNDFYSTRKGDVVSTQRASGRFIHIMSPDTKIGPATFNVNLVANSVFMKEPEDAEPYLEIGGYVFNYNGTRVFPVKFECHDKSGIDFFQDLNICRSEPPCVVNVWGKINTTVVEKPAPEAEAVSAGFGVRPVAISDNKSKTIHSWVVDGADIDCVPRFGTVEPFTIDKMKELINERLARMNEVKANGESRAQRNGRAVQPQSAVNSYGASSGGLDDIEF